MGIFGAGGAQAAGNIQNQARAQAQDVKQMLAAFQADIANDLKDLKEELSGRVTVKDPKKDADTIRQSLAHLSEGKKIPDELAAQMVAVVQGQEEVDKKRRNRRKFEEKLEQFENIINNMDTSKLSEKEKQVLEKFKKNLKTMKQLSRELKLLETEEEELSNLLKQLQEQQEFREEAKKEKEDKHEEKGNDNINNKQG